MQGLAGNVLMFVLIAITAAVGVTVLTAMQTSQYDAYNNLTIAGNATGAGITAISNITSNLGLLATIIIFGVVIAAVVIFFTVRAARS